MENRTGDQQGDRSGDPNMSMAFVFPGQGSQSSGMLHDLLPFQVVQQVLDEISEELGSDVRELDSEVALASEVSTQLVIFSAGLASARALVDCGIEPSAVAGHSIGAFAAAVIAGVLTIKDAVELVRLRAQSMISLYPSGYGLSAIVGLSEQQVSAIVQIVASKDLSVFVSNINAPRQIVIAGAIPGMDEVLAEALHRGAQKAIRLHVPALSHCPLLQPIADLLHERMSSIEIVAPRVPYVANVTGRAVRSAQRVADDLAENVAHGVRWYDASVVLSELGCSLFLEVPPGNVLSDLANESLPSVRAIPVNTAVLPRILQLVRGELKE
jgi:malonate decarboxylase epsilon subunit